MQFIVGLLLFIALLHGDRNLTIFALLVLGMASGAKLWTRISLSGIKCHSAVDQQKVFPGQKLTLRISAENDKFLPVWLQVNVPVDNLLHPASDETTLTKESSLLWYQRAHFQWELTAQSRGVYQIGPAHIVAGDLFAFFSREKKAEEFHHIIVYPRLVSLKSFPLPRRDFFGVPGLRVLCRTQSISLVPEIINMGSQPNISIGRQVLDTTDCRKRFLSPRNRKRYCSLLMWINSQGIRQMRNSNIPLK